MVSLIELEEPSNSSNRERFHIIAAVAAVLLAVLFFLRFSFQKKQKLPPGPRRWPLIGSLLSLAGGKVIHATLFKLSKKHGPLMYLRLGFQSTIVVSNAGAAKEILGTHDLEFAGRPRHVMAAILVYDQTDIGWASYGPHWRQLRKICSSQLFTASRLEHFKGVRERETNAMVNAILRKSEKGIGVDMSKQLGSLTMNIITQMMWSKRHRSVDDEDKEATSECENFAELIKTMLMELAYSNVAKCLPFGKRLAVRLLGWDERANAIHKRLDDFLEGVLSEHQRPSSMTESSNVTEEDNFVQVLLKVSNDSNAEGLSRDTVKATLLLALHGMQNMIMAGTDTCAVTLEWALAELIKNPSFMQKAQEELNQVVGEKRLVNESDIPNLKYLQAVIKETLRLHPPSPLAIPHFNRDECPVGEFVIPGSTTVLLNVYAIQRDPALWQRPTQFDPGRFFERGVDALDFQGRDFRYIPFGSGRRRCPGLNLGVFTSHLALAQLVHAVSWSLPGDHNNPEDLDMSEIMGVVCQMATL